MSIELKNLVEIEEQKSLSVAVELTSKKNAPKLQSFAHGVDQNNWLLIAGTNEGLHNLNGNYASTSFLEKAFNQNIYVYDVSKDLSISITIEELEAIINSNFKSYSSILKEFITVFRNTNSLSTQVGEYLYIAGGYGPESFTGKSENYITYNQIAQIHIPSLIALVKRDYVIVDAKNLFAFGSHSNFAVTGGELLHFNDTFYLSFGQNFGATAQQGQKYADAVYPFTLTPSFVKYGLLINMQCSAISDVEYPTLPSSDTSSIFRRRDCPIVPSLYKNPTNNKIENGLAVFAGVFKAGFPPAAWSDAIYIHPTFKNNSNAKRYTQDSAYNQNNYNVYTCPNFSLYESKDGKDIQHTFLIGGIGNGKLGFTNTALHIQTNMAELKSTSSVIENVFDNPIADKKYFGSEAVLIPNNKLVRFKNSETSSSSEIIDLKETLELDSNIKIGYIFGGIESDKKNPQGGQGNTQASNKIWKVSVSIDS
ncbi:MAG: hypothetical protein P8L42_01480 [Flavicella sp.]|nr:hypothetical protein [Flavicella sp.]